MTKGSKTFCFKESFPEVADSCNDGGRGHLVDAASSVAPEDPVVALLAPGRAPRVLDDPEGHVALEQRVVVNAWVEQRLVNVGPNVCMSLMLSKKFLLFS